MTDLEKNMLQIGEYARKAAVELTQISSEKKNDVLQCAAQNIIKNSSVILEANQIDVNQAKEKNLTSSFVDRLTLNNQRINDMAIALEEIILFDDPVGKILDSWKRPNGLNISRVSTPLGVIGIIYESRPNVTSDAAALCLKSGNASILRGGSDSINSSIAIYECYKDALIQNKVNKNAIQLINTPDRKAVSLMLKGLNKKIDVIVPRGGKNLVERVERDAKVPVFGHLDGICHIYIDKYADIKKAVDITFNAKMRRPGICGAAETVLIHKDSISLILPSLCKKLVDAGCEIRGCKNVQNLFSNAVQATEKDWSTEYLLPIISIKSVDNLTSAINHIYKFSSGHTESIITENKENAEIFLSKVDSAIVMHNTSTQFADGGEFGLGGEIGIATGKFHARGPVGVNQLTSFKYKVRGISHLRD